ncbi:hypothetical protein Tco_1423524, partial [Tanacetum coccineum]
VHIEQTPAFESMDLALTVVKAIAGQTRIKVGANQLLEESNILRAVSGVLIYMVLNRDDRSL